jgi:hypothetical protein
LLKNNIIKFINKKFTLIKNKFKFDQKVKQITKVTLQEKKRQIDFRLRQKKMFKIGLMPTIDNTLFVYKESFEKKPFKVCKPCITDLKLKLSKIKFNSKFLNNDTIMQYIYITIFKILYIIFNFFNVYRSSIFYKRRIKKTFEKKLYPIFYNPGLIKFYRINYIGHLYQIPTTLLKIEESLHLNNILNDVEDSFVSDDILDSVYKPI